MNASTTASTTTSRKLAAESTYPFINELLPSSSALPGPFSIATDGLLALLYRAELLPEAGDVCAAAEVPNAGLGDEGELAAGVSADACVVVAPVIAWARVVAAGVAIVLTGVVGVACLPLLALLPLPPFPFPFPFPFLLVFPLSAEKGLDL